MSETVETVAPEPAAPEASAADDLRSAISSAFDEASGTPEPEAESGDRDERGRFVARDGAEAEPEAAEAEAEPEPEAKAAEPVAVPPEMAELQSVLDRYKPLYAARGVPPVQALVGLFEAQKVLEERPEEGIRVLARQFGVDLSKFAPQPQHQQQAATPELTAVMSELQQLKAFITTQQQQAVAAENAKVEQSISAFASDPNHSHFPVVRHMMGALMQAAEAKGETMSMADAYEAACRAHPTIHKASQQAAAETKAKVETEAKAKAAATAKTKAVSVRGGAVPPGFRSAPDDLRGVLNAAWDGRLN